MERHASEPAEMTGRRFGLWLVIEPAERRHGRDRWLCHCDCGTVRTIYGTSLRTGDTRSCRCALRKPKTGTPHNRRLYQCWADMHRRCTDPEAHNFHNYGGRGITVCAEWIEFSTFRTWALGAGYAPNLTIDRIMVNEGYSPGNCRWADHLTQCRNRRAVAKAPDGTPWPTVAIAHGVSVQLYNSRVSRGWPRERAATTPSLRAA